MSMRPWVGYVSMGKRLWSWTWRMAWAMGMGMRAMGGWLWAWVRVGHEGVCRGGRSPMAMAGGGGEWGPHTKESIKCIPSSGTLKN